MPTKVKEKVVSENIEPEKAELPVSRSVVPEETLLEWKSPIRVYKQRSRQFWTTAITMAFLVGLIMFFVEGWMPVAVVVAFMFLMYVMSSVPPEDINHQITTKGIKLGEVRYFWGEMYRFWISEKWGQKIVNVDISRLPGRITFLLGSAKEDQVKELLSKHVLNEVAKPTFIEKASEWVGKKVPFETE